MLALVPAIAARLAALPALAGWEVRTSLEAADRKGFPAVDVRCTAAAVADRKTGAALVSPEYTVTLMARRADGVADALDAVFAATVGALHNWRPGSQGGRNWEPMALQRVSEALFSDAGVAGYELGFTSAATYMGQN